MEIEGGEVWILIYIEICRVSNVSTLMQRNVNDLSRHFNSVQHLNSVQEESATRQVTLT